VLELVDSLELAANVELLGSIVEVANSRVLVVAAKDLLGLELPARCVRTRARSIAVTSRDDAQCLGVGTGNVVWHLINSLFGLVNVLDGKDSQIPVIAEIPQCDPCAGLDGDLVDGLLRDVEGNWHAEKVPGGKTVVLDDAVFPIWSVFSPSYNQFPLHRNVPIVILLVQEA